ncbi:MAG: hypothetical protein ABI905_03830 [Betaproteobacteria bacterium]
MVSAALQAACDNAINSSRRGDTRSSIGLARHAYRLARQESPDAELEALNSLALCQGGNGSFIESIATSIDAFTLGRQLGNRGGAAFALTTMAGSSSFILDANIVVLDMLQVCRDEANDLSDAPLQVRVHNTFGLVYGNLARFDEADAEYDQGIALVNISGGRAGLVTPAYLMSGNKAFLSVQRARHAQAATPEKFDELAADADRRIHYVLGIAQAEHNIDAEARAFFCLGQLRGLQGKSAEALTALDEALTRATQIRHNPRLIDTNIEISKLYSAAKSFDNGLEALEAAYEIADANRPTSKVAITCEGMAAMYASLGRSREAMHYEARAARERENFERENEHAVRDLKAFWQTVAADHTAKAA